MYILEFPINSNKQMTIQLYVVIKENSKHVNLTSVFF